MKKFYSVVLLAILWCVASNVMGQQVPNPGFEDWNGEKFDGQIQPKDWFGSNISQAGINFNLTNQETWYPFIDAGVGCLSTNPSKLSINFGDTKFKNRLPRGYTPWIYNYLYDACTCKTNTRKDFIILI